MTQVYFMTSTYLVFMLAIFAGLFKHTKKKFVIFLRIVNELAIFVFFVFATIMSYDPNNTRWETKTTEWFQTVAFVAILTAIVAEVIIMVYTLFFVNYDEATLIDKPDNRMYKVGDSFAENSEPIEKEDGIEQEEEIASRSQSVKLFTRKKSNIKASQ
jgi:NADH:ubiquinone oxidoreductase subunit 6 (subunit J)